MAIEAISKEYCTFTGSFRMSFVLDSDADKDNLPESCPGSVAIVAAQVGNVYMVNASGEWEVL